MKLIYSPKSREDLREIADYIKTTLLNEKAAENISGKIVKACSLLKDNPLMGAELSGKINRESDMRYLVIKNHIAFYRVEGDKIMIIRILDARTNYINIIFKDI